MQKNSHFLYLTTTGWKSGNSHEIEIWFVEHDGCYYLISEHDGNAHWVQNINHHAEVTFWVAGATYRGSGCIIDAGLDFDLAATIRGKMNAKYGWSEGLIVELCPRRV